MGKSMVLGLMRQMRHQAAKVWDQASPAAATSDLLERAFARPPAALAYEPLSAEEMQQSQAWDRKFSQSMRKARIAYEKESAKKEKMLRSKGLSWCAFLFVFQGSLLSTMPYFSKAMRIAKTTSSRCTNINI